MAVDFENLAQTLLERTQGGQGAADAEKYLGLLRSPESKQLLGKISDKEKEELAQAGLAASQGDGAALRRVMLKLMSSKEGAALVKQAMEIYHGKG